jgi:hypothetical protein
MGNISYQLGRTAARDDAMQSIQSGKKLPDAFERLGEHLSLNAVDLQQAPMTLGPWLTMDSDTEKFVGEFSNEANMYLSRNYREPFIVPQNV